MIDHSILHLSKNCTIFDGDVTESMFTMACTTEKIYAKHNAIFIQHVQSIWINVEVV